MIIIMTMNFRILIFTSGTPILHRSGGHQSTLPGRDWPRRTTCSSLNGPSWEQCTPISFLLLFFPCQSSTLSAVFCISSNPVSPFECCMAFLKDWNNTCECCMTVYIMQLGLHTSAYSNSITMNWRVRRRVDPPTMSEQYLHYTLCLSVRACLTHVNWRCGSQDCN